jgi:hypothetical protein
MLGSLFDPGRATFAMRMCNDARLARWITLTHYGSSRQTRDRRYRRQSEPIMPDLSVKRFLDPLGEARSERTRK